MQLKTAIKRILLAALLVQGYPVASWTASDAGVLQTETITHFAYRAGPHDTPEIARALALYGAKYEAVVLTAEALSRNGLLKNYGDQQPEIFSLVADDIQYRVVAESLAEKAGTVRVSIESNVSLADFVRGEIRNMALEQQELQFSLQEEMEPVIPPAIDPGQELSRAYRYIRKTHWRMAIIYLDHLGAKYPHWDALFLAKARGFLGMHEPERAMDAFAAACALGNQDACQEIETSDGSE